jgi:hypothetical protein
VSDGTWAVCRDGSDYRMQAGFTQAEAERHAAELPGLLDEPDAVFTARDLLPELEKRFPPGAAVWLGERVHWRRGQRGTVTAALPDSLARWVPAAGPVPWFISAGGGSVFVVLDDGSASWWPAKWLDTR